MEELQKAGGFLENAEFSGTNMKIRHLPILPFNTNFIESLMDYLCSYVF